MSNFKQIDFIKEIYFNRMGGTENEKKAADIIIEKVRSLGGTATYEPFEVDYFDIDEASLCVLSGKKDYYIHVTGYGRTGCTPKDGIEAPFMYAGGGSDLELEGCEGKIVFVNGIHHDLYKKLLDKKAAGFLTFDGSIFDDKNKTDLAVRAIKKNTAELGELPGLLMRAADALKLVKDMPKTVKIKLQQRNVTLTSGNVVAEIPGTEIENEKMAFTAHYDSTRYSKGAWDNASGCANLMSLYSYYIKNRPMRTVRFIWCGSEELGLLGSKAYVKAHKDELDEFVLGMNIDMTGTIIGSDIACVSGDDSIKAFMQFCAAEIAFPVSVSTGVFPSDSTPFAHAGVPFVIFQRGGQGGMHSRNDVITALSEESLRKTTEYIRFTSERMLNSKKFPAPRNIPQNIKEELDRYCK